MSLIQDSLPTFSEDKVYERQPGKLDKGQNRVMSGRLIWARRCVDMGLGVTQGWVTGKEGFRVIKYKGMERKG
jgi:hypothetical protein